MQRAQAAEVGPGQIEVEGGKRELPGNDGADKEADDAPEDRRDRGELDGAVQVVLLLVRPALARMRHNVDRGADAGGGEDEPMDSDDIVSSGERQDQTDDGST